MSKIEVLNTKGEKTGRTLSLPKEIFGIEPHQHAVYLDIKSICANQRQGTHKTKERGEVRGSTKKILRQKGSGNARKGDRQSPILRGGGTIFGPQPRTYTVKVNKKTKKLARKSVLSLRAANQELLILEPFTFETPKTKQYIALLNALKIQKEKVLLVLDTPNKEIIRSANNLQRNKVTTINQLNTYDLLHADRIILLENTIEPLKKQLC